MADVTLRIGSAEVGTLHTEGRAMALSYSSQWQAEGFALGPDAPLGPGRQYRESFGFVEDASPDRWGRTLIAREAKARAKREERTPCSLQAIDYFLGVSDVGRRGALRAFVEDEPQSAGLQVPPLVALGKLLHASSKYQSGEIDDEVLEILLVPGSSLGGARPKATVQDAWGELYMAKFPRSGDDYSVERWEWIALELAKKAGVDCVDARLEEVDGQLVLLSKRFDRQGQQRLHFASAMNLLELKDGDKSSYADIADVIQQVGERAEDSVELFRRMIFNIVINNVDDHLRNHGFLRGARGWFLSPAYDVNPMSRVLWAPQHATSIVDDQIAADIPTALEAASFFDLSKAKAQEIVEQVREAVSSWRRVADSAQAPRREITEVEDAFFVG